jgi:hypothetical protein
MDHDGALSAWRLTAVDGRVFHEAHAPWPALPEDVVVAELAVGEDLFTGFQAYGWQRYTVAGLNGRALSRGYQVLGLVGDWVLVTDVDEVYGRRVTRAVPLAKMTYDRRLLRRG